jgi:hypothetical protein
MTPFFSSACFAELALSGWPRRQMAASFFIDILTIMVVFRCVNRPRSDLSTVIDSERPLFFPYQENFTDCVSRFPHGHCAKCNARFQLELPIKITA